MLTTKDFGKVLITYKRKKSRYVPVLQHKMDGNTTATAVKIKGDIKGVIVAIDSDVVGWSLCDKKDKFNKEFGIDLALKRARIASKLSIDGRNSFYCKVPFTLWTDFAEMLERSQHYFQNEPIYLKDDK